MTGQTSGADEFQASCAGGARSPENIYRIVLRRRRRVRITVEGNYDQALYLRRDCLDQSTEVACNDDHGDNRHSLIETTLLPLRGRLRQWEQRAIHREDGAGEPLRRLPDHGGSARSGDARPDGVAQGKKSRGSHKRPCPDGVGPR